MSRWVAWLAAALILSSCHRHVIPEPSLPPVSAEAASTASTASTAPNDPTPERATQSGSGVARPATAKERAAVDELVRAAESVRQLRLRRPVTIEIEDGDAIANNLRSQIEEVEIERARLVYGALGLLDADEDLRSMFAGVLGEQVIGYYDPDTGRLVIRDDVMAGLAGAFGPEQAQEARLVLVHELVHALQDQRLGLGESYEKERTADADNAFRAVVEGDATLAMLAHALRQQGIPLSAATAGIQQMGDYLDLNALVRGEKLDDAPAILRVTLVAPYLRGLQFVAAVQGRGGWPAVNNAHRRPPTTSEQVLHPDKYFAREPGEEIEMPDNQEVRAAGFERIEEDTLGPRPGAPLCHRRGGGRRMGGRSAGGLRAGQCGGCHLVDDMGHGRRRGRGLPGCTLGLAKEFQRARRAQGSVGPHREGTASQATPGSSR
ncbi:MAG: hypothetical protein JRJ80_14505 [Deltaproteobacteria bacterium]|nr:hypothetical protein [Deltaproteobacteria bacterium]